MSSTRRLSLTVDDPLEPRPDAPPADAGPPPAPTAPRRSRNRTTGEEGGAIQAIAPAPEPEPEPTLEPALELAVPWRTWGGTTRPASYRLASDLLDELDERTHNLRLPIGLTVTAALLQLLDMSDDEVVRLVDRAEESQERARRAARRRRAAPAN